MRSCAHSIVGLSAACAPWVTVGECVGSRRHVCLTKHSGTRKKGGLSAGPQENRSRAVSAAQVPLPQRPPQDEKVCTRLQHLHARSLVVRRSLARWPSMGPRVLTKTLLQPKRVSLVILSDDRGMSHSANIGRGDAFETGLSLSTSYTPTASRFQAASTSFTRLCWRSALSRTHEGPAALTGRLQSRFTLLVTHQELSALGDRTGGDSLPRVGELSRALSRFSARPTRLAAFSS